MKRSKTVLLIIGLCLFSLGAAAQATEVEPASDWNQVLYAAGTILAGAVIEIGRRYLNQRKDLRSLSTAVNEYREFNEHIYADAIANMLTKFPALIADPTKLRDELEALKIDLETTRSNSLGKRIEATAVKGSPTELRLRALAAKTQPAPQLAPKSKADKLYPDSIAGT